MERKLNFLVAEDNPGDVFLIRRALDSQGFDYDLLVARDGEEAIRFIGEAAAGTRPVDLLLLDLNLPRRDGTEVLTRLREQESLRGVPVILLTSSDSPQDRERCMRLGADRYFQKPSTLAGFMQVGEIAKELVTRP